MKKKPEAGKPAKTSPMMPAMGEGTLSVGPKGAPDVQSEGTLAMGAPSSSGADLQAEGTMAVPMPSPEGRTGDTLAGGGTVADAGERRDGTGTLAGAPSGMHKSGAGRAQTGAEILFAESGSFPTPGPEVTPGTVSSLRTIALKPLPPGGVKIGKYHLKSELGRGGMGVVFRATDLVLNREIALKLMLSQDVAEEEKIRFLREAESSAALKHPYIVGVHDISTEGGCLYFSMDYVEGKTFKAVIQENQGNLQLLLPLFGKTCEGVGYAHRKGIIHRDLKPQNVMVDPEMNPHIMDFGLARKLDDKQGAEAEQARKAEETKKKARLTQMGALMGTPVYMPPEQAGGRVDEVDTRSDIYSLGVILYSILTGDLPFRAKSTPELLLMIEEERPPLPSSKNPSCPWELERIVLKAIEKKKDDRYQTCFDLKDDIEAWLTGRPVVAVNGGAGYVWGKWVRRNKGLVAASVVGVIALGGAGGWLVQAEKRAKAERAAQVDARVDAGEAKIAAAQQAVAEYWSKRASLAAGDRLAYMKGVEKTYAEASQDVNQALGIDGKSEKATAAGDKIKLGQENIRTIAEAETREEERLKAELAASEQRKKDAERLATDAAARVKAIDPSKAVAEADVVAAKSTVEAGNADLLKALGLDPSSKEAQEGLGLVRDRLMRLEESQRSFEDNKKIARLLEEAGRLSADGAAAEEAKNLEEAFQIYRKAVPPLTEALRLDASVAAVRDRRVEVALKLGELALAHRKPEVAELVVDEVADLDAAKVGAFRERVRVAKEDGARYKAAIEKAAVARAKQQWDEAAGAYKEALNAAPGRSEAEFGERFARGASAAKARKNEEALAIFAEAGAFATDAVDRTALDQAIASTRRELAATFIAAAQKAIDTGRLDDALRECLRAKEFDPESELARRLEDEVQARRKVPAGTVLVAKGAFTFGVGSKAREGVEVERFFIRKTEVTNREYAEFVADGGYEKKELWDPAGWESRAEFVGQADKKAGPLGWLNGRPPEAKDDLPVAGISWYEARAFATWKGKGWRLPSEVEWEKAATWDPAQGRKVDPPWITTSGDGAIVSTWGDLWRRYYNRAEPKPVGAEVTKNASGAPVYDRSPIEADDMWGNVREWVVATSESNTEEAGARGGSYASRTEDRSTAFKPFRPNPLYRALDVGFRLAKSSVE